MNLKPDDLHLNVSHLTQLGLNFLICKMGTMKIIVLEEYQGQKKVKNVETLWKDGGTTQTHGVLTTGVSEHPLGSP